ncbi:hypothetical protein [Curtobacterium phage Penoan]|nr:hypothetical protein [Curtobacterium phage Penoan]
MTDQTASPATADNEDVTTGTASLDGLLDQAKATPQGIAAMLYAYGQELAKDSGRMVGGVVLISAPDESSALQSHVIAAVDGDSMAALLRLQADAFATTEHGSPADRTAPVDGE